MKKLFFLFSVLMCMAIPALVCAQLPGRQDAVVIKGKNLPDALGELISKLGLMRWTGKAFEPVPFQIDEKTAEGASIYTDGKNRTYAAAMRSEESCGIQAWKLSSSGPR